MDSMHISVSLFLCVSLNDYLVSRWSGGHEGSSPVLVQTCRKTLCGIYSQLPHTPYTGRNCPGCHTARKKERQLDTQLRNTNLGGNFCPS